MTKQKKWSLFWWCFLIISFMQQWVWYAIKEVAYATQFFHKLGGEEHSDSYEVMFGFGVITILCTIFAVIIFAKFFYKAAIVTPFSNNKKIKNIILTLIGAIVVISFIGFNLYDASLAFTGTYAYENLVTAPIDYLRVIPIICWNAAKFIRAIDINNFLKDAINVITVLLHDFLGYHTPFYIFTGVLIATLNGIFRINAKTPQNAANVPLPVAAEEGMATQVITDEN